MDHYATAYNDTNDWCHTNDNKDTVGGVKRDYIYNLRKIVKNSL